MTRIKRTIAIKAPVEKVFRACDNPSAFPLFVPSVTKVSNLHRTEKRLGDTFNATYALLGSHFDERFTYAEYESPNRITAKFEGGFNGSMGITLEPTDNGTKATLDYEYKMPAGVLGRAINKLLAERRVEKDSERLLENLKMVCELGV